MEEQGIGGEVEGGGGGGGGEKKKEENRGKLMKEEERITGAVKATVYKYVLPTHPPTYPPIETRPVVVHSNHILLLHPPTHLPTYPPTQPTHSTHPPTQPTHPPTNTHTEPT